MGGIEPLIVFTVAALHLAVMPGCVGFDELMSNAVKFQMFLKKGRFIPRSSKTVCEFGTVVCLNTLNGAGKSFYQMLEEDSRGVGTVFFKSFHKTPAGILIFPSKPYHHTLGRSSGAVYIPSPGLTLKVS